MGWCAVNISRGLDDEEVYERYIFWVEDQFCKERNNSHTPVVYRTCKSFDFTTSKELLHFTEQPHLISRNLNQLYHIETIEYLQMFSGCMIGRRPPCTK